MQWKGLDNHYLLWHGSKLYNFLSIFYQGLRIAPPEAPATGYMFGKGIYFADMFSKSVGYCQFQRGKAFILLCEVALGNMHCLHNAEYMDKPPDGFHSVKGCGKKGPDFSKSIVLSNGVVIPTGETIDYPEPTDVNTNNNKNRFYWALHQNEYIVFDVSQVRIRYLLQISQ